MDRTAIFVDAGYVYAAGSRLIANERLSRSRLNLDYDGIVELLQNISGEITGIPLLRIYWYDGTGSGPTPSQRALAFRNNIKLRLGFVTPHGEQKGVDTLLVSDLIALSKNRAMTDAVILTGDEDIRVGVQHAQEYGIRVHLLGIEPARENQSTLLAQEVDTLRELGREDVSAFMSKIAGRSTEVHDDDENRSVLEETAYEVADALDPEEVDEALDLAEQGSVPSQIDRRLLIAGTQALGGNQLSTEQKRLIRGAFVDACRDVWK
jgi:uncharacterized LabA/DUF88 family protein